MVSEEVKEKFISILRSNGIDDEVANVTISKPDLRGEHMASIIEVVHYEFNTGREPLQLFVKKKLPIEIPGMEESPMSKIMINEGSFFTAFVDEMKKFRTECPGGNITWTYKQITRKNNSHFMFWCTKSPDLSDLFPRVYYFDGDMIVIEDLTARGYKTLPKSPQRNFEETKIVFEHLARYHAVSHVLLEKAGGPEKFVESRPYFHEMMKDPVAKSMISQAFEPSYAFCITVLKKGTTDECPTKAELMEKYAGKLVDAMEETVDAETKFWSATHGDCWNNNVMFDMATKKKVILVDLQVPRVNSPTLDLVRFLFFSSASEVRKRWRELLQYYYQTLQEYVVAMDHPFPYTFEDFEADFRRKGKMDFLCAFLLAIGFDAIAKHDTEDTTSDIGGDFTKMLTTWVDQNPDLVSSKADMMVEMINDFLLFGTL